MISFISYITLLHCDMSNLHTVHSSMYSESDNPANDLLMDINNTLHTNTVHKDINKTIPQYSLT